MTMERGRMEVFRCHKCSMMFETDGAAQKPCPHCACM